MQVLMDSTNACGKSAASFQEEREEAGVREADVTS